MTSGPRPAAPPSPHRGMVTDRDSAETIHRHPDGADGARLEHSELVRHK